MKNKISVALLLVSLLLNTNIYSKDFVKTEYEEFAKNQYTDDVEVNEDEEIETDDVENEDVKVYEESSEKYVSIKSKDKYLKKLSKKLRSELEQIKDPKEKKAVERLIKKLNASKDSTTDIKTQYLSKRFKDTIQTFATNLTSKHSIVSIAIATTACAIRGILNSSIALQIIRELTSAYKWGISAKLISYIICCIPLIK